MRRALLMPRNLVGTDARDSRRKRTKERSWQLSKKNKRLKIKSVRKNYRKRKQVKETTSLSSHLMVSTLKAVLTRNLRRVSGLLRNALTA